MAVVWKWAALIALCNDYGFCAAWTQWLSVTLILSSAYLVEGLLTMPFHGATILAPVSKDYQPLGLRAIWTPCTITRTSRYLELSVGNFLTSCIFNQQNGTLFEIAANRPQWHRPMLFCLDMKLDDSSPQARLAGGVCYPDTGSDDDSPGLYIAYGIGKNVFKTWLKHYIVYG